MQLRTHAPALLLAATLIGVGCQSARAAPPPPPPPPPAPSAVAEGVLQRYLSTPYGELNGLRLRDGRIVLFGPPMAQSVREAAAVGDPLRVIGHSGPDGVLHAVVVLNLASGRRASEQPPGAAPPPPPAPRALQRLTAAGTIDAVLHGPRGEANGVLLTDGALIYFRPELASGPLSPGQPFTAIGIGTKGAQGLAMEAVGVGADPATARQAASAAPGIPPPKPKEHPPHAR
ncbi:hypothetical protein GTP44_21725 [Duganella sp. FT50W]|uniref:Uncharacterized protein n=1 Tax=Duganella lactea TaxID=2692173 RepID=A0A6L8MR90_9BURK|nr:hypothetical protein [Duganella lactea]MYM84557.1 hypothetical protein [Duganella lactea]